MRKLVGVAFSLLVALAACEDFASPTGAPPPDDNGDDPGDVTPMGSNLRIVSGDEQKGIARDTLIDPLVVQVSDENGIAVAGVEVSWQVVSGAGGGVVLGNPTVSDADGIATNRWRVGNSPGAVDSIVASIETPDGDLRAVTFSAEITGVPDTIVVTQGAIELDNNATRPPEEFEGDTVFVQPGHWSDKAFKATVIDSDGRTVRGAVLTWTVTDDLTSQPGTVGDEPEGSGSEAVMVVTDDVGSITVWRKATEAFPQFCLDDPDECWIGATLSLEDFPDVTPMTLDARVRDPGEDG